MIPTRRPRALASLAVVGTLVASVALAGCTAAATSEPAETSAPAAETTISLDPTYTSAVAAILAANADWTTVNPGSSAEGGEWDASTATDLAPTSDTTTITEAGVYRLSGSYGPIVVAAPEDALVVLILDGATVENASGAAISVESADDVAIHLADGSVNTVAATIADAEAEANAAIHARTDLTISGTGTLAVEADGVADGIASTDDLVILGGDLSVTAADDALRGKDSLVIEGGSLRLTAGGDAMKSTHEEDGTKGFVAILGGAIEASAGDDGIDATTDIVVAGGTLTVSATDDGLHSEVALAIGGGTVTVADSEEGIESFAITIEGGTISVASRDDGINASGGDASTAGGMGMGGEADGGQTVTITGGTTTIDASGDGLDSNGSATMSGGTLVVYGPTDDGNGALDVNGAFTVAGGELVAVGSAGMAVAPDSSSAQSFVAAAASAGAGSTVTVQDASGAVVAELTTPKRIASVVVSTAAIVAGETYTILVDGSAVATATAGEFTGGGMMGGMGGPGAGGMGGGPGRQP